MKLNMTKIAAAMVLLGSVGAHAAVKPSSVTTQTAALNFKTPAGEVTLTITPATDLTAGNHPDRFEVAALKAAPTDKTNSIAIRFTPTVGVVKNNNGVQTVSGANNASNKLTVSWSDPAGNSSSYDATSGYWHYAKAGEVNSNVVLKGAQDIASDTYTVSMDAALYQA